MSVTHCTHGVTAVSGRSVDLDPGEAREFTFQIRTYKALGSDYSCEVQLFDADYNLIQSAQVSFATNGTCFCYGICGCVVSGCKHGSTDCRLHYISSPVKCVVILSKNSLLATCIV